MTERISDLRHRKSWDRILIPIPVQSMEAVFSWEPRESHDNSVTSFMDAECHPEQTTGTFKTVPNKDEVPFSYSWPGPGGSVPSKAKSTQHNPVPQVRPSSSQICLTYNAAYRSCRDAISEDTATLQSALPNQRTRSSAQGKLLSFHF